MKSISGNYVTGLVAVLFLYAAQLQAGTQKYGQSCNITPDCASSYQCVQGYCDYASYTSGEIDDCKAKLIASGLGASERVAVQYRYCYHEASCPGLYQATINIEQAESIANSWEPGENKTTYSSPATTVAEALRRKEETPYTHPIVTPEEAQLVDSAIKAAKKICNDCKVAGKQRCFTD